MKTLLPCLLSLAATIATVPAADSKVASTAINALGVDLYRLQAHGQDNLLLSPYSIQCALAMTYAGASGRTQAEMQRVLHYSADEAALDASFGALAQALAGASAKSVEAVQQAKGSGGPNTPLEFHLANRLFAEQDYTFRAPFLDHLKNLFQAPLEKVDYHHAPDAARIAINRWVEEQTRQKIRDLIPPGVLTSSTRLTLVNTLYLRAPWAEEFDAKLTAPAPFQVPGHDGVQVPTMVKKLTCGYAKLDGYQAVALPYFGGDLQLLILLPDDPAGLSKLEKKLTPELLAKGASMPPQEILLHLPKLRLQPGTLPLNESLKTLGMKTAFDDPKGTADFDRMAPRRENDYLYISAVLHKTFLVLDEKGTEAAAATAVVMMERAMMGSHGPLEVRVDHPFLFALQHVPSGACLFLGRVTDPR